MIPRKLKIKNFGAIPEAEIDFSGISLASIVGANGRGKSTFFTWAPLFALFGKTKPGLSVDDFVRKGQQDMMVQFEFEHQGAIYQATRTRSLKGKGKSSAELQKLVDGAWQSLTEAKIADTDKKIRDLLSLDADTFIASSMILQNDASNFTKKPPGERKAILAQVLGLEIYDKLQKLAKAKADETNIILATSQTKIADLATKLEALPDVQAQFDEVKKSVTLNAVDIRDKENELAAIQGTIKELEDRQNEAKQLAKNMVGLHTDILDINDELLTLNEKIEGYDAILESEPEITARITELAGLRSKLPALEEKVKRLTELETEETRLSDEEMKLADEQSKLATRMVDLELELSVKDELQQTSEQYQQILAELIELDSKAERHRHFTERLTLADKDLLTASTKLDTLLNQLTQIEKKVAILADSRCIDSQNAKCKFLKDAQEAKAQLPGLKEQIEDAREALKPLYSNKQSIEEELEDLAYDSAYHAKLKNESESLRKQAEKYAALSGKEELLQTIREQRDSLDKRITDINDKVLKLQVDIKALKTETASFSDLKAQITVLEPYEKKAQELPQAKANREAARQQLVKLEADKTTKTEQHRELREQYNKLNEGLQTALDQANEDSKQVQISLKNLQSNANTLFTRQGSLQNQIDALLKDQEEHQRLSAEIAPIAKELIRWQLLVRAFGKNGIPVLILENSLPELERISNNILDQMSAGRHSMQFSTQRDAKTKDTQIETLDILISDWAGTRPYESFSGGEQLRIDLAIRLGLAELLASRAGSKIEFTVLDEVFGSQDAEHRELIIDSLKAVSNRFKQVLVISHIEQAQAAFPQQIIMSKGGKVEVVYN